MCLRERLAGIVLAAMCTLSGTAVLAGEPCRLIEAASLDMGTDRSGGVYVPMSIAGRDENLLVDTGGIFSTLKSSVVDDLGLRRQPIDTFRVRMTMYGGYVISHYVDAHDIKLQNLSTDWMTFLVMPDDSQPEFAGTLAPDIMGHYDVELDFAKGKFNLFLHDHCEGVVVYWTRQPHVAMPMHIDDAGHITLTALLDGKEVEAMLDTGSPQSMLSLESARSIFGWDDKTADLKPIGPPSPDPAKREYRYPFHTLTFEGISDLNPYIVVVPDALSKQHGGPPLIIGMGILRQLHLYLAYKERKIYATAAATR